MTYLEAYITDLALYFFLENQHLLLRYTEMNSLLKNVSGINNFFSNQNEATELHTEINLGSREV